MNLEKTRLGITHATMAIALKSMISSVKEDATVGNLSLRKKIPLFTVEKMSPSPNVQLWELQKCPV